MSVLPLLLIPWLLLPLQVRRFYCHGGHVWCHGCWSAAPAAVVVLLLPLWLLLPCCLRHLLHASVTVD